MSKRHFQALGLGLALALGSRDVAAAADRVTASPLPDRLRLVVTGNPASPDFVAASIRDAVERALRSTRSPSRAAVQVGSTLPATEALDPGFLTNFRIPLAIAAGAQGPFATATLTVDVENAALAPARPEQLAFADDPEKIVASGVLSRTRVERGTPTRLYYYHENIGQPRRFCVVLAANDSVRTHVHIIRAAAGPSTDVMGVGHAVSRGFLTAQPHDEGIVAEIVGGQPLLERDTLVGPGDGVVGALDLRVLDGGPVTVTVLALPPNDAPDAYLYGPKLADDGHERHGTFALTGFAQRIIGYTAGGPDARYRYGTRTQTPVNLDPADSGHDYGDYGVLERIAFDLDNPDAASRTLYLYERPLGGVVRSSFVVNGALHDLGCARLPSAYLIAAQTLEPHGRGRFDVLTMTDGGSNYPLELGVTTVPPIAATPPIRAADGCFPKPARSSATAQPASPPPGH
jgi:hypothetical protein